MSKNISAIVAIIALVIIAIAIIAIAVRFAKNHGQPIFAFVDIALVVKEQETALLKSLPANATETQRTLVLAQARDFALKIPTAINDLANACGCVLLQRQAVAAGAERLEDKTDALRALLGGAK